MSEERIKLPSGVGVWRRCAGSAVHQIMVSWPASDRWIVLAPTERDVEDLRRAIGDRTRFRSRFRRGGAK